MLTDNQRRLFLKGATTIPILGGALLAVHTILRFFKPTMAGGLMATALVNVAFGFGSSMVWFCCFWALNGILQASSIILVAG